ncbi:MAG: universal stress protein [Anaerolineaceae bacterium]|nr:universal stress protein [Anaerolineaceae bacterium]
MKTSSSIEDFNTAHRRADIKEIVSFITGKKVPLLSYDDVRAKLQAHQGTDKGLHDIPLKSIIGSVGRYTDFTRDFLPRHQSDSERWARVYDFINSQQEILPIQLYKIGEAYFVLDGNHRVSVARHLNFEYIPAYVTELSTLVPISPDTDYDELIIKEEYTRFLKKTRLDYMRPDQDLIVTAPGMYEKLEEHINTHRYFMGIDNQRDVHYFEAVTHWFDEIYLPVAEMIARQGILGSFPGRTETDMYIWIMEYRADLESDLGWQVEHTFAAANLVDRFGKRTQQIFHRIWDTLIGWMIPKQLENGPATGDWRSHLMRVNKSRNYLFKNILVSVHCEETSWLALEQALVIGKRESAKMYGIHVSPPNTECEDEKSNDFQARFQERCQNEGLEGNLVIETGNVSEKIVERARWTDLVVVRLIHAPEAQVIAKLRSGLHTLLHRTGRPLLAVPGEISQMNNALLAYDGSPKGKEALYVAAYLAKNWHIKLSVITVANQSITADIQDYARDYLRNHRVNADFIVKEGNGAETILQVAQEKKKDFLIMGSYGLPPIMEVMRGSSIDKVLMDTTIPVLICR